MENEVGCYLILGAYTEKLRKRADLKNGEICKKVHIGHYVKVVECCLDAFNEEEAGAIWDEWRRMYFQYRRRKEEERGER